MKQDKSYTSVILSNSGRKSIQREKKESFKSAISPASSKANHMIYGMFTDCKFLSDENRHFIVKIVKKLIEVPYKSKLKFKLDKANPKDPH